MKTWRLYGAEMVGTAALLCAVIGSGIMAEQLAGGNMAVALLANTLATVFALYVLIETIGPISGAHFNPVVSLVMAWRSQGSVMSATGRAATPCSCQARRRMVSISTGVVGLRAMSRQDRGGLGAS